MPPSKAETFLLLRGPLTHPRLLATKLYFPESIYAQHHVALQWAGDAYSLLPCPIMMTPPLRQEWAVPPFGLPRSLKRNVRQSSTEGVRQAMAATRVQPSACEIFTTLEYGPVPESHACALVRDFPAVAVYSPNLPAALGIRAPIVHCGVLRSHAPSGLVLPAAT